MKPGDIITLRGVRLEVIDWTDEPVEIQPANKEGSQAPIRVQLASVREIRKPRNRPHDILDIGD